MKNNIMKIALIFLFLSAGCANHQTTATRQHEVSPPPVAPPALPTTPGSLWTENQGSLFYDIKALLSRDLHYFILGKKTQSHLFLVQVKVQLPLLLILAKSYVSASKSFAEGSPIGDALGPMVIAQFVREISHNNPPMYEDINESTILQKRPFENRFLLFIRAKGPGGTTGKPGTAIKKVLELHSDEIVRIITIDAGIKLEGDKTGMVVSGVGAAIGGFGVEKSKIEDISTKNQIPLDALICRQSLEDAICTMKKPILDSVPIIIEKTKTLIRRNTEENQSIIIAGIGNTIGVGI